MFSPVSLEARFLCRHKIYNSLYLVNLFLVSYTLTSPYFKRNREGYDLKITLISMPFIGILKSNNCQHHGFDFHHFLFLASFSGSYRICSILYVLQSKVRYSQGGGRR